MDRITTLEMVENLAQELGSTLRKHRASELDFSERLIKMDQEKNELLTQISNRDEVIAQWGNNYKVQGDKLDRSKTEAKELRARLESRTNLADERAEEIKNLEKRIVNLEIQLTHEGIDPIEE